MRSDTSQVEKEDRPREVDQDKAMPNLWSFLCSISISDSTTLILSFRFGSSKDELQEQTL